MSKTNTGLVKYAKAMLGHPYWYGCYGQVSTKALYKSKKKQYPNQYEWPCPKSQLDTKVFDCVGLIKGYLWSKTINSTPKYNASQDVSANGMLSKCKKKGKINTLPEVPGTLVFRTGHVGVYIGGGKVIEAKGHKWGVVESKLKDRNFTHWGYCPWIDYSESQKENNKDNKVNKNNKDNKDNNDNKKRYFKKYTGTSNSIVDALESIGADFAYSYREKIAKVNGINDYEGTPSQNTTLLNLLKKGKLIKP